jgi:Ca2+:H+ antiporter
MDLALGIAMGSSMQIALFVAPVLVIAGTSWAGPWAWSSPSSRWWR